jgi:hypothetical protein
MNFLLTRRVNYLYSIGSQESKSYDDDEIEAGLYAGRCESFHAFLNLEGV